jgi:alkaline phosphatase
MFFRWILVTVIIYSALAEHRYHPKQTKKSKEKADGHPGFDPLNNLEGFTEFWNIHGRDYVRKQVNAVPNTRKAKNIIMFLGDGMSPTTSAATRMYLGGEEVYLSYEKFPHLGMVKTYCVNVQVPDSACTATAFLAGVKNNRGVLGLTANVSSGACTYNDEDMVYGLVKWAQDAGKATGIVTTTRVTHAVSS